MNLIPRIDINNKLTDTLIICIARKRPVRLVDLCCKPRRDSVVNWLWQKIVHICTGLCRRLVTTEGCDSIVFIFWLFCI